jgi:hypothetical protein
MNLGLYAVIRVVLLQRKSVSLKFFGTVGEIEPLAKKGAAGKNIHYRADFSPGSVTDVSYAEISFAYCRRYSAVAVILTNAAQQHDQCFVFFLRPIT